MAETISRICGRIPMKMPFKTEPNFHIRILMLPLDDFVLTPSNMKGENAGRIRNWGYNDKNFLAPCTVQISFSAFTVMDMREGNKNITIRYSGGKMGLIVVVYFPSKYSTKFSLNKKLAGGKMDL